MKDWQILLLSGIISVVMAYLTSHISYKSDVKKELYIKRTDLYTNIQSLYDKLLRNASIIMEEQFYEQLDQYKSKINLYASNKVVAEHKKLMEMCMKYSKKYSEYKEKHDYQFTEKFIEKKFDEWGECVGEVDHSNRSDNEKYIKEQEDFINSNIPIENEIPMLVNGILSIMRKDLGNNKVNW